MSSFPPTDPRAAARARQRVTLAVVCTALIASAIIVLVMPVKLPIQLRLLVVGGDLVAALILFAVIKQRSR